MFKLLLTLLLPLLLMQPAPPDRPVVRVIWSHAQLVVVVQNKATGEPIVNALITILDPDGATTYTRTNAAGFARLGQTLSPSLLTCRADGRCGPQLGLVVAAQTGRYYVAWVSRTAEYLPPPYRPPVLD